MRVEPHAIDSYVHVVRRGARGLPIVGDESDKRRFVRLLFYMNDTYLDENWSKAARLGVFERLEGWPEREPLVSLIAFTLMPNHTHLIARVAQEDGLPTFMRKVGQSMTNYHNKKYRQMGSLFQGSYRSKTIADDGYMQYAAAYVMVKNVFELYPNGGLRAGMEDFETAWRWAIAYPYSSLRDFVNGTFSPVLDTDLIREVLPSPHEFKGFSRDVIKGGKWLDADFE
ncbi:MAG: transposase [Patescibacteria group bacterium]|nr:transposase [Patescibacteria group bacterium]MDE1944236.1 transposase [Patescibacteria group bacterium]MDE1945328.1 transposase [Patescibacteria group bacterium]MDE2057814.1 transposase [Patescibacteria group bacterium]